MHDQSQIPQWKAPETLLPRLQMALARSSSPPPRVSAASILITATLCAGTGIALSMVLGIMPAPSAGPWLSATLKTYNLMLLGQRLGADLFAIVLCNKLFLTAAVIYGAIVIPAGIAGMGGIVYLVNHIIIPRSAIK
jgi:hypothetical protein